MGEVYRARDARLGRDVALKVLPAAMASNPERLARFEREARAVAGLNHPSIVTLHSVEDDSGVRFLTMELVEGRNLHQTLGTSGLPLSQVLDIGIQVADALAAAHEKGIVHRDFKPANVMLTKDGRVKVLDFGLATLAERDPSSAASEMTSAPTMEGQETLTSAGLVVGTVPYMSPEQVGGEPVDVRTDIFSLGVVLYEMATGHRPFQGKNDAQTISSILRDAPRALSEVRHDAPRDLARILDHCLQKDPDSRFQTAKDVRNELRALRKEVESGTSEVAVASRATSTSSLAVAPAQKKWLWVGVAAVVLAAVIGVVVFRGAGQKPSPPVAGADAKS